MNKEADTIDEFHRAVNMTGKELETWLQSDQSRSVGEKRSGNESTGHESGRHIVHILATKKGDLSAENIEQMSRVISYVHRHLAQRPDGDVTDTRWRYSLMNWGHDPLKNG